MPKGKMMELSVHCELSDNNEPKPFSPSLSKPLYLKKDRNPMSNIIADQNNLSRNELLILYFSISIPQK